MGQSLLGTKTQYTAPLNVLNGLAQEKVILTDFLRKYIRAVHYVWCLRLGYKLVVRILFDSLIDLHMKTIAITFFFVFQNESLID